MEDQQELTELLNLPWTPHAKKEMRNSLKTYAALTVFLSEWLWDHFISFWLKRKGGLNTETCENPCNTFLLRPHSEKSKSHWQKSLLVSVVSPEKDSNFPPHLGASSARQSHSSVLITAGPRGEVKTPEGSTISGVVFAAGRWLGDLCACSMHSYDWATVTYS